MSKRVGVRKKGKGVGPGRENGEISFGVEAPQKREREQRGTNEKKNLVQTHLSEKKNRCYAKTLLAVP